ncbi:MAG: glutathione S-transferase family protein [Sneathiella sp.]|nr:glutathione S-transferase family protein [Sneathiella sp.]
MVIKVYTVSGAPRGWRVLLGLAFKKLNYDIQLLEFSKGDLTSEEFLKLNPRAKVPVLVDGPVTIRDSIASLLWLDRAYPDNPLFGSRINETADILQTTFELSEYLRAAQNNVVRPVFFEGAEKKTPELFKAAEILTDEINKLEVMLEGYPFLRGDTPTAADAVAFPELKIIQRAVETKKNIMSQLGFDGPEPFSPKVTEWIYRLDSYSGVSNTFPPHWKE